MITLRPYQTEAVESIFQWFAEKDGNPLIVLPTGTGKSLVIASLCQRVLADYPESKILVVTHVRELIAQNYAELLNLWANAPAGINSAGIGRRDYHNRIVFCGVQSVSKHAHKFGKVDLVLVDEAHMIPRDDGTRYSKLIRDLTLANPYCKVIGLTATPYRLDSGRLDKGEDKLFDGVSYDYGVLRAVREGFLSSLVSKSTELKLDTTGVGTRGGDFIPGDLQRAVDKADTNSAAVDEIIAWAREQDRKRWLIFASGVDHAKHLAELVRERGFSCETIFGETPKADRDRIIADFKAGRITALCSMGVLTTGFNAPAVDLIAMLRPTKSTGLYVQICGRGMRLHKDKANCLVLDFAGNVTRHGPIDAVDPKEPGKGDGDAPVKECPECSSIVHAAVRTCPDCGHEFPAPEPKITPRAVVAPVLTQGQPEWVEVDAVEYRRHSKQGKPDSLLVIYTCGYYATHREWICLQHDGYAKQKAHAWWRKRAPGVAVPATVTEALRIVSQLAVPEEIAVRRNGKYTEVVDARGLSVRESGAGVHVDASALEEDVPF